MGHLSNSGTDPIEAFYDRHPYPPPVVDLDAWSGDSAGDHRRAAHHLVWPRRSIDDVGSVLVAGCGTSQAARHALRRPDLRVVGIDVSATSIEHTRRLARQHGLGNLEAHRLSIEQVDDLGERFDHVVCTGVLHHLVDPVAALRRLRGVLAPDGAITLMVYGSYGRVGVAMLQEYCRRLGVTTSPTDLDDLVTTLGEISPRHPVTRLLRGSRDVLDDDALADALLNPRERSYTVPELLDLLADAGLRFGRWLRQAPYLPDCGAISETPHARHLGDLPREEQWAAVELFRGTMDRHTVIAVDGGDSDPELDFADPQAIDWRPIPVPTAVVVEQRLPPGAAAALLNRAHTHADLVMFVDHEELDIFRRIDGRRTIRELGNASRLIERFHRHDLVVVDASGPQGQS